jgi:hypothetical protein
VGAAVGKTLGWMVPDVAASYLNPELANRSALLDVAEYAGGKVLGTVGSRVYRKALQPALASRGLLSPAQHPVLARAIPLAEQVLLEPATGPGAPKGAVGVPKRTGAWLRRLGPQGVEPEAAMAAKASAGRLATAKRVPWTGGEQGPLGIPQVARQVGIPGTEAPTLAAARMRGRGLPQYPGGAVSVPPPGVQGPLTFPSYQLPLPGGSSLTVTPAVRGAASRTPHVGLGVPSLAPPKSGLIVEAMRSLPPMPERVPLVSEVPWGERAVASPFNFPKGYQLGKGTTRAVRPKSPFNFPKGYQLGEGPALSRRQLSTFDRINEGVMKAAMVVGSGAGAFDLTTVARADLARRKRKEPSDWEVVGKISQEYRTTKKAIRETKKKIRERQLQVRAIQEQSRASR